MVDRDLNTLMRNRASFAFTKRWCRFPESHQISCLRLHNVLEIIADTKPMPFAAQVFAQAHEDCPLAWHLIRGIGQSVDGETALVVLLEVELACGVKCAPMELRDAQARCSGTCSHRLSDKNHPPQVIIDDGEDGPTFLINPNPED